MKIAVLIKQVPDTESKIRVKSDGSGIEEADVKFVVSPYDEFAIEEALQTKGKVAGSETVVISLGPERAIESIRTALAMGIDKGIHIDNEGQALDSYQTAKILAAVIKEQAFDVVFCGKQAIDGDCAQVTQMIAEILDWPQIGIIEKFEVNAEGKGAIVTRRVGGGAKEIYDLSFPALLGCDKGLNSPRYASLPGIMKAKAKPVEKLKGSSSLEGASSLVQFVNYQPPPEKKAGKKIEGEAPQQASELVRLLREEAKVI